MRFHIVSNDTKVCSTLTEIIKNNNFGQVTEEHNTLSNSSSNYKEIDIIIIDLLTPVNYYLKKIQSLINSFTGKIIIVSETSDKAVIAQSYFLGVEYYIVKPIHRVEVLEIIKKAVKLVELEYYGYNIKIPQNSFE